MIPSYVCPDFLDAGVNLSYLTYLDLTGNHQSELRAAYEALWSGAALSPAERSVET